MKGKPLVSPHSFWLFRKMIVPTWPVFLSSQTIKKNADYTVQKCDQLFTAIAAQEHKPANIQPLEVMLCLLRAQSTSLWNCISSFNNPGVSLSW